METSETFFNTIKSIIKKSFSIKGRESHQSVILYFLFASTIITLTYFLLSTFKKSPIWLGITIFLLIIPIITLIIRRFHDHGKHGVFAMLPFIFLFLLTPFIRFNVLFHPETYTSTKWLKDGIIPVILIILFFVYSFIFIIYLFSKGNSFENQYGEPKTVNVMLFKKIHLPKNKFSKILLLIIGALLIYAIGTCVYKPILKKDLYTTNQLFFKNYKKEKLKPMDLLESPLFPEIKNTNKKEQFVKMNPFKQKKEQTPIIKTNNHKIPTKVINLHIDKQNTDIIKRKEKITENNKEIRIFEKIDYLTRFLFSLSIESLNSKQELLNSKNHSTPSSIKLIKAVNGDVFFTLNDKSIYPWLHVKGVFCQKEICVFNHEKFLNQDN